MRKIEKELVNAIANRKQFSKRNTYYDPVTGVVQLYGNTIAKELNSGAPLYSLAGWNTATTRSRLAALGVRVNVRKGSPGLLTFNENGLCVRERTIGVSEFFSA